ncbi:MAG: glutathione-dependent reductase [Pseudomonadales bacterium]|jgi:glutathionyl-hydroquinone reductase|uniref:glutathione S-transferase family protein n=1 Tax=unclassified Ketobacter TaxID=2639109 RepID=UPI000C5AAFDB|nr:MULTISPECIES: glutathione S-transferase family protein [unclassified Ketobacter]MAA61045.1 glutathione-dependent reductase [Pseudomonadales bacterium]MEC8810896.1 glutathione S-transferase family protein [Pseudomonadota bacterium]TNC89253.1 MAG: glutathione-dependent reductase [Alcanivorax sp.]HAG93925.1 glutathione-dependent reductase [Gammaproteobacteria bacterium]MAQ25883.1 glutathione-dependent reductase [Pseudomonadales bacterium]|tara:strand:+ start:49107 stop:50090 length:984 start_codon:yes stop_codon:yes gene_type:complete
MGLLVEGRWLDQWYDTESTKGRFERSAAQFRNWVTADGRAGPTGAGGFKAEPGRYHLYVSLACPWAHRTLIFRKLKGLESLVSVAVVNPLMLEHGWTFAAGEEVTGDTLYGLDYLYQVYLKADPQYSGRVTVPVLWDKVTETVVSNESADIIRMFNSAFDGCGASVGDFYPPAEQEGVDRLNHLIYNQVNNGVYRAGFATTQEAYEEALLPLFETLDYLEQLLESQRYLVGSRLTEADWRLFTTLIRFDAVYHGHFKCNLRRIRDYPNLDNYMRELYQWPGVAETTHFDHIKTHYYASHGTINPSGIVPLGPLQNLDEPHNRQRITD